MSISFVLFAYMAVGLVGMGGLAWFYDRRQRRWQAHHPLRAFRCARCEHVYGARPASETAPCPVCDFPNQSLRF